MTLQTVSTPDTVAFMWLGYALMFGAGALYIASLIWRLRRARRAMQDQPENTP